MTRYYVRPGVLTENGWPMVNSDKTVSVQVVPAAKRVPLLRGDVATILNAWIILYDREVEPIRSQIWGWSPYNDVWNSNHMSGTAIDIHAPWYPWGARKMPAHIKQKVFALLEKFDGVIYWGAGWNKPDEMHYQIGVPPSNPKVRALAEKLNNGYLGAYKTTPTPPPKKEVKPVARSKEDLALDQLVGHPWEDWAGWPQLGNRSLVDAVAAIGVKLGIDGFKDTKK